MLNAPQVGPSAVGRVFGLARPNLRISTTTREQTTSRPRKKVSASSAAIAAESNPLTVVITGRMPGRRRSAVLDDVDAKSHLAVLGLLTGGAFRVSYATEQENVFTPISVMGPVTCSVTFCTVL